MTGQASTWDKSQGLKSLFENLTVDADTIAQAKKDIAEDGYWGVEKTSDRILDLQRHCREATRTRLMSFECIQEGLFTGNRSLGRQAAINLPGYL